MLRTIKSWKISRQPPVSIRELAAPPTTRFCADGGTIRAGAGNIAVPLTARELLGSRERCAALSYDDALALDSRDSSRPSLSHDGAQLAGENIEYRLDARLAIGRKPPALRTSNANCRCSQGQRLEHVGSPTYATVQQNRSSTANRSDDFRQALDGSPERFFVSSTVIRNDYSIDAVPDAELGQSAHNARFTTAFVTAQPSVA